MSVESLISSSVIFITGSIGLFGKALIEALIRTCSQIYAVYESIGQKHGKTLEKKSYKPLNSSHKHFVESEEFDADEVEGGENDSDEDINFGNTSIESFYAASVIFITGATGFLGKALIEKLLRTCPHISTIYIVVRSKEGMTLEERYQNLIGNSAFERLRSKCPEALKKIVVVKGDMSEPQLGLSEADRIMLMQKVNMIFHVAATVSFDEPLKDAVISNTRATQCVIDLASNMPNLISFIHVSTAYSNADRKEIRETVYKTAVNPETAIEMCENLNDDTLKAMEKLLQGKHPNTYTWTKGLTEYLIMKNAKDLPITIVRPSMIGAGLHEPTPGWLDNLFGPTGGMAAVLRGIVRSALINEELVADFIPVDYVVDTLITAAWHIKMRRKKTIQVYNCVSGDSNPLTWRRFKQYIRDSAIESPSEHVIWYPDFTFRTDRFVHRLISALLHTFPAYLVDLVSRIQGHPPIMVKTANRFEYEATIAEFFSLNEWKFHTNNMKRLSKAVKAAEDGCNFTVDITTLNWATYIREYMLGIRKYLLHESSDSLPYARSRLSKLFWIRRVMQVVIFFLLLRILFRS